MRPALIAVLAAVGALVAPAAAGADVTSVLDGKVLTVTGTDDADTITLGTLRGLIAVNGIETALPADGSGVILVKAGGGDDVVDASALTVDDQVSLEIDGGAGDDVITGGAGGDRINGDGGDDRLVGFQGGDDVFGGDGNDLIIWNNGDGSDFNQGDAGVDEVQVNGSPTGDDAFVASPGTHGGDVVLHRVNLNTITIDLFAEHVTVNGLGGGDAFTPIAPEAPLAGLTTFTLNGGTGDDKLVGGNGDDTVNGGSGDDSVQGGEGDDVLTWSDGDGNDTDLGGPGFDRLQVSGSPSAGDVFSVDGAQVRRTNLVPFALDVSETEAVDVSAGGGNDEVTVASGPHGPAVTADGGSGDDQFFTRDGAADLVRGGSGNDSAQVDALDTVSDVEAIDAPATVPPPATSPPPVPPPSDTVALLPKLGKVKVVRRHGRLLARIPVTCPAGEPGGCRTMLTLRSGRHVLGTKAIALRAGRSATVSIRLATRTRQRTIAVVARIASVDAAGNRAAGSVRLRLRLPASGG